jgi:hypothetical protein
LLDPFCWDSCDHVMLHPINLFPRGDPPFVWPIPVRAKSSVQNEIHRCAGSVFFLMLSLWIQRLSEKVLNITLW